MTSYEPRSAWGARDSRGPTALVAAKVEGIALHWPGMEKPITTRAGVIRALQGWQNDHMDNPKKRWSDIAYQAAFDQSGTAWTLRGYTNRSAANGNEDVNDRFGAILLILAPGEKPSPAMLTAVRGGVADFRARFPKATKIVPHSAIRPAGTDCPGDVVRGLITAGAFNPVAAPTTPPKGAPVTQLDRIEKLLTALALAETNRYADMARRVQGLTSQEAGRYQDYVRRFNAIMTELADDPASPITATDALPAVQP